jgi:ubiquitin conjugation factor E4 B
VKDPQRFHFNPRFLLSQLVEIYLHFGEFDEFIKQVVMDGRSFRIGVFKNVRDIIARNNLLPEVGTKQRKTF